jgi:hypothetical protein
LYRRARQQPTAKTDAGDDDARLDASIKSSCVSDRQKLTPPQTTIVAVATSPERVDLFSRVTSGDGGVAPLGRREGLREDLPRGIQDVGERVVGGRRQGRAMAS